MHGWRTLSTGAIDSQPGEARAKGGPAESPCASRRAELRRGRQTNSRLNRRQVQQAYGGYGLGPKRTWRQERGNSLRLDNLRRAPGCIPPRLPANSETPPATINTVQERSNPVWFSARSRCQPDTRQERDSPRSQGGRESRQIRWRGDGDMQVGGGNNAADAMSPYSGMRYGWPARERREASAHKSVRMPVTEGISLRSRVRGQLSCTVLEPSRDGDIPA